MADSNEAAVPTAEATAAEVPTELKDARQESSESVGSQPRTTARRQQRREDAEKQAAAQTKQGGSWGWGSMWSAVSDFGAAVADKVIDALDSVEDKMGVDDDQQPKPTLSQLLQEARERPADQPLSPKSAGGKEDEEPSEPPTPSLSQLLREAAERKEQPTDTSLLAVVGGALESIVAEAPAGLTALAHTGAAAVESLSNVASAVFGSDEPTPESKLTAAMDEHLGLVHLNALSLLSETLTEENRARPMTVAENVSKQFLRDVELIKVVLEGDDDVPDEPATAPAVDRLCTSLSALGPHVTVTAARAAHTTATEWADASMLKESPREEIRAEASKQAIAVFASLTSAVVEQLHKTGETWALRNIDVSARDRAFVQADQLHEVLTATAAELDFLAALFSDVVLQTAVAGSGVTSEDEQTGTTIMLDSAGSMDLVRTAVGLFLPILQAELWDAIDARLEEEREASEVAAAATAVAAGAAGAGADSAPAATSDAAPASSSEGVEESKSEE